MKAEQYGARHTWSQSQIADTSSDVLSLRVIQVTIYNLHVSIRAKSNILTS